MIYNRIRHFGAAVSAAWWLPWCIKSQKQSSSFTLLSDAASFDKRASVDLYYVSILRWKAVQCTTKTANTWMQNNSLIKNACARVRVDFWVRGERRSRCLPVWWVSMLCVRRRHTHTQVRRGVGQRRSSPVLGHTVSRRWKPVIKDASRQSSNQREREGEWVKAKRRKRGWKRRSLKMIERGSEGRGDGWWDKKKI